MRQALSGAVYRARSFSFTDVDQDAPGEVLPFVTGALADADQLQHALVARSIGERRPSSTH